MSRSIRGWSGVYAALPVGDPRHAGTLVGPLDRRGGRRGHGGAPWPRAERRAASSTAASDSSAGVPEGGVYVRPALVEIDRQAAIVRRGDVRAHPLRHALRDLDEAIALQQRRPPGPGLGRSSPTTCARPSGSSARRLRLRHRQRQHRHLGRRDRRRLRRREGDRRRPREPAATPGRPTCAGRPTRSTTARPAAGPGRDIRCLGPGRGFL